MESIVAIISFTVAYISIIAGIVTIVWFIKDMRKENSKVLKSIQKSSEVTVNGLESIAKILAKIEAKA